MEFRFKDLSSSDFKINLFEINKYPIINKPKFEEVEVPGKKGTYKFPNGYEDRVCEIDILINNEDRVKRIQIIENIAKWLNGSGNLTLLDRVYQDMTVTELVVSKKGKFADVLSVEFRG